MIAIGTILLFIIAILVTHFGPEAKGVSFRRIADS